MKQIRLIMTDEAIEQVRKKQQQIGTDEIT